MAVGVDFQDDGFDAGVAFYEDAWWGLVEGMGRNAKRGGEGEGPLIAFGIFDFGGVEDGRGGC